MKHFNKVKRLLELSIVLLSSMLGFLILTQIFRPYFSQKTTSIEKSVQTEASDKSNLLGQRDEILPEKPATIIFGGDLMFDRLIRQKIEQNSVNFILEPLSEEFKSADLVVANLEGPVTTFPSRSVGSAIGSTSNYIFTFDPKIVPLLKELNMTVNLGNNHISNFGADGIEQTKTFLKNGNVKYFGNTGSEVGSEDRIVIEQVKEFRVAFVNMNQFVNGGFDACLKDVEFAKNRADLVIVYTHWGLEYKPMANEVIQEQAHELIDAGADTVIGSHPHVVQQSEIYKGKSIYYSLGNLVFDQYQMPETQVGQLVKMQIKKDKTLDFSSKRVKLLTTGQTILSEEKIVP